METETGEQLVRDKFDLYSFIEKGIVLIAVPFYKTGSFMPSKTHQ